MEDIYKPDFPENPEGPGIRVWTPFGYGRTYDHLKPVNGKQLVYLDNGEKITREWNKMKLLEIIPIKL